MSRKNNKTNKKSNSLPGGELAAIERMIIQNAKPKAQNKNRKTQKSRINGGPLQGAPIGYSSRQEVRKPQIQHLANGDTIVTHRELVSVMSTPGNGFQQIARLRVNPSSKGTFKWLSAIAPSWETYRFDYLRFHYIPRCGATVEGSFLMLPEYDAADTNTLTEERASQHLNAVEEVLWKELKCPLPTSCLNRAFKAHFNCTDERFIDTKQDVKTLDCAQFFAFCDHFNPFAGFGKLWVEYKVKLMTPQPAEIPLSLGGAGSIKTTGLAVFPAPPFTTNTTSSFNNELTPILEKLDPSLYPGGDLYRFTRDWTGFITKEVEGIGLSGTGSITRNGTDATSYPNFSSTINLIVDGALTHATRQIFGPWKQGDTLGSGLITATSLSRMLMNLGGSNAI
jgi:hypothetical protein